MIIAVDFDGTLCSNAYPDIGEPNKDLIKLLIKHKMLGDDIILWTGRSGKHLIEAVTWCVEQGLRFDAVNDDVMSVKDSEFGSIKSKKVYADIYIDDKNVLIEDFIAVRGVK